MSVTIRTGVPEEAQRLAFENATLQTNDDGYVAFSVATHISGLRCITPNALAEELRGILTAMSEAVAADVEFEVEVGEGLTPMTGYAPGLTLPEPCPAGWHGVRYGLFAIAVTEYDPDCYTCMVRKILRRDHDHLHLRGEECTTLGISGVPGQTVKCKCGGFHH